MRFWDFSRNDRSLLRSSIGIRAPQDDLAIADQTHIHRVTQADAGGGDIDLNGFRLTRLRQKLNIREACARDDERVAFLQRVLRRRGSQKADAADAVRVAVRDYGFPDKALMTGAPVRSESGALRLWRPGSRGLRAWQLFFRR